MDSNYKFLPGEQICRLRAPRPSAGVCRAAACAGRVKGKCLEKRRYSGTHIKDLVELRKRDGPVNKNGRRRS